MMVATQGQSKPSMVARIAIDLAARRLIGFSSTQSELPGVVESRSDAVATYKPLRFDSPLNKPGVRISLRFGMQRFLQLPDGAAGWQIADDMRGIHERHP